MLAQLRHHRPSPAMVVALAALFVALGGSSYAALALKANSVSSKHIKNGQVKGVDLGKASVDSSKVVNGKLLAEDFAAGQLPAGERGPQGPQGAQGAQGAQGLKGEPGADGADGLDRGTLAAQPRCDTCPVPSGAESTPVDIPLTDSEWTQDTNNGNILFYEVTWTPPPAGCTAATGVAGAQVQVQLDGNPISVIQLPAGAGENTTQGFSGYIFAPDIAELRTVTAQVADNCTGTQNAEVQDVKVDVISSFG
jgi:hypothetical protein